ncbi:MAG: hypothetical protein WC719_04430 [Patescibacteria group bacterium]
MKKIIFLSAMPCLAISGCSLPKNNQANNVKSPNDGSGLREEQVLEATSTEEPSLSTTTKTCEKCILYSSPAPGWCKDGTIVPPLRDECGCLGHPTCISKD